MFAGFQYLHSYTLDHIYNTLPHPKTHNMVPCPTELDVQSVDVARGQTDLCAKNLPENVLKYVIIQITGPLFAV